MTRDAVLRRCGYDPEPDRQARLIDALAEGQTSGAPWLVKVFQGTRPDEPRGGLPRDPQV